MPEADGFGILLDQKPLKLPGGKTLSVPFEALAAAIAEEWAQPEGKNFTVEDLPLTRLASTAQDRVWLCRDDIIGQLAAYGMNDLLCYEAGDQPELAAREHAAWRPWRDWTAQNYDVRLAVTSGIIPINQPPENRIAFTAALAAMTDYQLAALGVIVPALGSLVLGLAVAAGALSTEAACNLAHLGTLWQEERWGKDDEAAARRRQILDDVALSARFIMLCTP